MYGNQTLLSDYPFIIDDFPNGLQVKSCGLKDDVIFHIIFRPVFEELFPMLEFLV